MRVTIRLAPLALLLLGQGAGSPALARGPDWNGDGGLPSFYHWEGALPALPGTLLRAQAAPSNVSLPGAGRAERILYSSTYWNDPDRRTYVSGILFLPEGQPPAGGWPVIAWAHGTTGIADVCAPSAQPRSERDKAFLSYWLRAGYAIVATDYEGLGSPGVHPYLNYRSEGIAILDAIRAVTRHYRELSGDRVVTMGQSQGSEAAIAAAYLAPRYAPDVRLKGTVATGIVARALNARNAPQEIVPSLYLDPEDYGNSAYEILWFLGGAHGLDPVAIRAEDYISTAGRPMLEKAQSTCMRDLRTFAGKLKLPVSKLYKRSIDDLEKRVTNETAFPDTHVPTPVFIGTGLADQEAQPAKQYNFASALCAAGTRVQLHYYPGATHGSAVERSLADAPAFVAELMEGRPVADDCGALKRPGEAAQAAP